MTSKTVDAHDLATVLRALNLAEEEIHHPGAARYGNYDIIDLIDQARLIVVRANGAREDGREASEAAA